MIGKCLENEVELFAGPVERVNIFFSVAGSMENLLSYRHLPSEENPVLIVLHFWHTSFS